MIRISYHDTKLIWMKLTKPQMKTAVEQWAINRPLRDAARKQRKLQVPVATDRVDEYKTVIEKVKSELKHSLSPCMPLESIISSRITALKKVIGLPHGALKSDGTLRSSYSPDASDVTDFDDDAFNSVDIDIFDNPFNFNDV